jgi:hypothetical protein
MTTQIQINEPGARTIRESRPMEIGGRYVYVTVGGGTAELHVEGRIVARREAETMNSTEAQAWAVEYRNAMNDLANQVEADAQDHMTATETQFEDAARRIREDAAEFKAELEDDAANDPSLSVRDHLRKLRVLSAWTARDESGYQSYLDGWKPADRDNVYPMGRTNWKASQI